MRRFAFILTVLAVVVVVGCEDLPSDPTGQPIVGTWKASKVGDAFMVSPMEAEFQSDGDVSIELGSDTWSGTYSTSGSSASSTVREVTINITSPASKSFSGIYTISGSQMKLEVVPLPLPDNVTAPDAALGIGSTKVGGSSTNDYVTEMQKQ